MAEMTLHVAVGGQAVTLITSEGGQVYTLAGSAGGQITSFAGKEYTIATAAFASATSSIGSKSAA